ncbi:uncharacterized protein [Aristolochia californica]|uniref:uncharacterized protein n=1 Tax=Aristolochia californica TaxID=171875 RepID=UPI0035D6C062
MDFIDGLPKSSGKSTILVVVDRFSKYGHFMALAHLYTATHVAQIFMDQIVRLHGLPVTMMQSSPVISGPNYSNCMAPNQALEEQDTMLAEVKAHLQSVQDTMKHIYDKHHRPLSFAPGDYVLQCIGNVAYHLQLPPDTKIHDIFHVSLLKPFRGDSPLLHTPLPLVKYGRPLPTPVQVLNAHRILGAWEVLVQWTDEDLVEAS